MSVLVPFVPHDPHETPISFATRLANFHVGTTVVPFLHDIEIRPEALAGCEIDAVEHLAEMTGVDSAALHRNSAHRVGKRRFDLRGEELSSEFFSSPDTIFCPACIRADDEGISEVATARRGRLEWTLRPVNTCPLHGLALVRRKRQRWDDQFRELARIVPERGAALDRLIEDTEHRVTSPLQDYVLQRLDGVSGPEWLDCQTLEQAVRATEMLGMRIKFGPAKKPSELTSDEWEAAGRAGYEVTSFGEPAVRDALHQMQAEFRGKDGKPGCRKIFGPFYEWLSSNKNRKDGGDITRILREHIFETMDVAPGQTVLGAALTERRLHSVQSLAIETGLDSRTLRNVLAARGLIPVEEKVSGHHVFDANAGRDVAASVLRLTHVSALDKALGCTRPLADQLLDERLLLPISDGPSAAAGRTWKGVDDREIDRFLAALGASARPVDTAPSGMVPIAKAAEKAKLLSVEIVHLILGGFLENVARLRGGKGYFAILVDPAEVRERSRAVLVGMSATAAFGQLKIPKTAGWALTERQHGPRLDPIVIEARSGQHRIYRFAGKTIADFTADFTTEVRTANKYGVEKRVAIAHLKRARVRPVLSRTEIGINLYRTADIPELEAA